MDNSWIDDLYASTDAFWQSRAADMESGYAIFYSPVHYSPKIMIIGYNPGGDKSSFDRESASKTRETHDYFDHIDTPKEDYPLARKMRQIFESVGMLDDLKESVKLNLYFFRSKRAVDLKDRKEISEFCRPRVEEIICRLQPEIIVTEGFGTFRELIGLIRREETNESKSAVKPLVRYANDGKPKVIGLKHPTGYLGMSTENLNEMGSAIKDVIGQLA